MLINNKLNQTGTYILIDADQQHAKKNFSKAAIAILMSASHNNLNNYQSCPL
jgi:hypothetical protein